MLRGLNGPRKVPGVLHVGRAEHVYFSHLPSFGFQTYRASRIWFSKYA